MLFIIFLSLALFLNTAGVFGCEDQCCDLNCWEQCFVDGSSTHSAFYQRVYQIVQTIGNMYTPCSKPHGTCYLLDSSMPGPPLIPLGDKFLDFERNLASIIALTQPVSKDCNPFFVNKFHRSYAWYAWSWQCQDKCNAARELATSSMRFTYQNGNDQPSWINGGCNLCDHAFNNAGISCSANTEKELLIAFSLDSHYQFNSAPGNERCNKYNRLIIGTTIWQNTIWDQLRAWASPGLAYQLPFSPSNLQATNSLLKCLNYRCCPSTSLNQFPIPLRRSVEQKKENLVYITENNENPQQYSGTFAEFEKNILKRQDTIKDQMKGREVDESKTDDATGDLTLDIEEEM